MTKGDSTNVHFKELNKNEKVSKLSGLGAGKQETLVVWEKGHSNKIKLKAVRFNSVTCDLEVEGNIPESLIGKDILASFNLKGLNFFGKCKMNTQTKKKYYINFNDKLFKSERRANFRLLTYPHQRVYLHIKVAENLMQDSNLVSIRTKMSETGLFTNFLQLVAGSEATKLDGYVKFRVLDLSVTGAAIMMGELENDMFPCKENELKQMFLEFNGEIMSIPNARLLYKLNYLAPDMNTKLYKGGIEFLEIDTNLDEKLSKLINETLRSLESEFEDFLT